MNESGGQGRQLGAVQPVAHRRSLYSSEGSALYLGGSRLLLVSFAAAGPE